MSPETDNAVAAAETLGAAVLRAQRMLAHAGLADAGREARLLVSTALGLPTAEIISRPERQLSASEVHSLDTTLRRRAGREPLSRILGEREFYGRRFRLSPATLDPRPDSETLIDATIRIANREGWRSKPIRILDVGTGTGCLLLTLLAELPLATGLGTDISVAALETAAANAADLRLGERAAFARHDGLAGIEGPFDLVVSNPPYIPTGDIPGLDPEVRLHDPRAALDGGADGLAVYRSVIGALPAVAAGWAVFEVGAGQAESVAELLQQAFVKTRLAELASYRDLSGHVRCVAMKSQL